MARQVTWKQVLDRGVLGAYRGQGIFCREIEKRLGLNKTLNETIIKLKHKPSNHHLKKVP